ncbi:hypothetical protein D3C84_987180 [compost metagenome]
MHVEPLGVLDLVFLADDLATGIFGVKAEHHRVRERPALAAHVLDVPDLDAHLFANFANQAVLGRFARLGKPGQGAVDTADKTR